MYFTNNFVVLKVIFVVGHTVFSCAIGTRIFSRDLENNANQFDNLPGFWPRTKRHPVHGLLFNACRTLLDNQEQKKTLQKVGSLLDSPWARICYSKSFYPRKNQANNNRMDKLEEA